jgi:hypothetical protein
MTLHAEKGFIEFEGWRPFKFVTKTSTAKWLIKKLLIDTTFNPHLSFRRNKQRGSEVKSGGEVGR